MSNKNYCVQNECHPEIRCIKGDVKAYRCKHFKDVEAENLLADIRNKMSPACHLIALVERQFNDEEKTGTEKRELYQYIKASIPKAKKSMEYLRELKLIENNNMENKIINTNDEFQKLAKPLIKYLNDNYNPHCSIIITTTTAEVLSGEEAFSTNEFVKD